MRSHCQCQHQLQLGWISRHNYNHRHNGLLELDPLPLPQFLLDLLGRGRRRCRVILYCTYYLTFVFVYLFTVTIYYCQFALQFRVSDYGCQPSTFHMRMRFCYILHIYNIQISLFGLFTHLLTHQMHLLIEFCKKSAFPTELQSFFQFPIFSREVVDLSLIFAELYFFASTISGRE